MKWEKLISAAINNFLAHSLITNIHSNLYIYAHKNSKALKCNKKAIETIFLILFSYNFSIRWYEI